MSAIITSVSAVHSFVKDTVSNYNQIISLAQMVLSRINAMAEFVTDEKDKLEKQLIALSGLEDTLMNRINSLNCDIDGASSDVDYYLDQYYRTDNSDDATYYKNSLEESKYLLRSYKESLEEAVQIQKETDQRKKQLQLLFRAISAMIEALNKNSNEVNKLISLLGDEITYNSYSISSTLASLEYYTSSASFLSFVFNNGQKNIYESASMLSDSSGSLSKAATMQKEKYKAKKYKIKSSTFGFTTDGTRPLYHVYLPGAVPVRRMLYDIMQGMHADFRDAVIRQLGGVVFSSAKHGFNYTKDSRGRMIYIIGVDVSSPDYKRLLLMHVGHYLYTINQTSEKISLDQSLAKEIARNINSSDANIRKLADSLRIDAVGSGISCHEKINAVLSTSGSAFFSQCFRSYVSLDYGFLAAVKSNFGESYRSFEEIISRLHKS